MYLDLVVNLSLLVAMTVISGLIETHWPRTTTSGKVFQGLLFGSAAVLGMMNPMQFAPGIIFDGRSVMISLCALFFGPLSGILTAAAAALWRIYLGGAGMFTGTLVIASSLIIGLFWRRKLMPMDRSVTLLQLFSLGLAVHTVMVLLLITLPGVSSYQVVGTLSMNILAFYPVATILAGKVLSDQLLTKSVISQLNRTRENLAATLRSIGDGVIAADSQGTIFLMNRVAASLTGYSPDEASGRPIEEVCRFIEEHSRKEAKIHFKNAGIQQRRELLLLSRNGEEIAISESTSPIIDEQGTVTGTVLVFRDISQHRWEQQMTQQRLQLLEYAEHHQLSEILTKALDDAEDLTGSSIAFFHFLEDEGETLSLQQWSTRTKQHSCSVSEYPTHYPVEAAGVWTDCIRTREAVVHNDFPSLSHRKGTPEGHPSITRQLTVPVIRDGKVKAILGVGNKLSDYHKRDVESAEYLADLIWQIAENKIARLELAQSEEKLRSLAESVGSILWEYHFQEDRWTYIAPQSYDMLGYRPEEWTDLQFWIDRIHPDDRTWLPQYCFDASLRGEDHVFDFRFIRKDGSVIWLRDDVKVTMENGAPLMLRGFMLDITKEQSSREQLEHWQSLMEYIITHDPNAIAVLDKDLTFIYVSRRYLEDYTLDQQDVIGRRYEEVFPIIQEKWRRVFLQALSGEVIRNSTDDIFIKEDGSVEYTRWECRPWYGVSHEIGGIILYSEVITEIRKVEQELRRSQELFQQFAESAPVGILLADKEYQVVYISRRFTEMFGYTLEDLPTVEHWWPLAYPEEEYRRQISQAWDAYIQQQTESSGDMLPMTSVVTCRDGSRKHIEFRYAATSSLHISVCFDVTQQIKLEQQLRESQKIESIGRLAGGVAHDFNNMLGVILGRTEIAMDMIEHTHAVQEELKEIKAAASHSADLTKQLLAFSRQQVISPRVINLNEVIGQILNILKRIISDSIQLNWIPGEELASIKMDPGQINQILTNLCINSRDAIDSSGAITIETSISPVPWDYSSEEQESETNQYVRLSVIDDGCGMDEHTREHIFDPFFTTKSVEQGTGLGLSTVYGIVKQNRGFITVYSEPGQGTAVHIYFPSFEENPASHTAVPADAVHAGSGETVLIVEDNPSILKMSSSMLTRLGYRVLEAGTPDEALSRAQSHEEAIHLLLTDVVIPGMNGQQLSRQLTAQYPEMKTLFMSGFDAQIITRNGVLEAGIEFIQKPFSLRDIADKVRQLLEKA